MAHFIFCILHLAAILFGLVGLIITIPLHLIYCAVKAKNKKPVPDRDGEGPGVDPRAMM